MAYTIGLDYGTNSVRCVTVDIADGSDVGTAEDKAKTRASWDWREVAASVLILMCILVAYLYFRG